MRLAFSVLCIVALCSCSSLSPAADNPFENVITKLSTAAIPDLQQAAADATAHNDVVAAQCWNGLIPVVTNLQVLFAPQPAVTPSPSPSCGNACFFSTLQHVRDVKSEINALTSLRNSGKLQEIRVQINLACAALWVDMNASVVDPLGLNSGPVQ